METRIIRVEESDQGIISTMLIDGKVFCTTLEPDHNDDEPCVPAGKYKCAKL